MQKKTLFIFLVGLFTLPLVNTWFSENESSLKVTVYQNTITEPNYLLTANKPIYFYLNIGKLLSLNDDFNLVIAKEKHRENRDIQPFLNNNNIAGVNKFQGFIHEYGFSLIHLWFFQKDLDSEAKTMKTLQSFIVLKRKKTENSCQLFNNSHSEFNLKPTRDQIIKQSSLAIQLKPNNTKMLKSSQLDYDRWPKFLEGEPKQNLQ